MFNFKDQYNKVSQKQCSNSVKNLRKELPKQSPFRYGSKKISFNVKNRSDYWDDIEKVYVNEQARIDSIIGNVLQNLMNGKDTDYDIADSVMYSPVSPVLAVTLVLLNKEIFRCDTFTNYLESNEAQVYAYTHWNGENFVTNPTALVIDNPFGNETEKYKKILPGYNNIDVMKFYEGYQMYMKEYSSDTAINNENTVVTEKPKFWGSYYIDNKGTGRFQRIFKTKPDPSKCTGNVYNNAVFKDSNNADVETLNMHPEVDSYLYADGVFKKLMDSPYNSQSYQISVLRGGYGFGPINIACFLKAKNFDIERITDIISGLLIAEDSGMPLIDAIKGIQEWRIYNQDSDIDTIFNSLSDIRILRYIEYIGSIFFTAILGSSLKEKPLINIPLTSAERKIYDVGYLMGHNHDIFVQMFKNGIKNKIWLKDSTEIFSFEVPCVLYGTEPTTGIFKIGDYVKNYSDSLLLGSEPLDYAFGVSSILEKEREITDYIIPRKGYTIFDFITKGLNNCLITEVLKNIDEFTFYRKFFLSLDNSSYAEHKGADIELISSRISIDCMICPRNKREITVTNVTDPDNKSLIYQVNNANYYASGNAVDTEKCRVNFSVQDNTWNNMREYGSAKYNVPNGSVIIFANNNVPIFIDGERCDNYTNLQMLMLRCDSPTYNGLSSFKDNEYYIEEGYYFLIRNIRYTVIEKTKVIAAGEGTQYFNMETVSGSNTGRIISFKKEKKELNVNCKVVDEFGKFHKLSFTIKIQDSDNPKYPLIGQSVYHNEYYGDLEVFSKCCMTERHKDYIHFNSIRSSNIQGAIIKLFQRCGFFFHVISHNYVGGLINTQEHLTYDFINRFALCILKLSVINAFCMSYSIDLLSLPDSVRSFYDIYKSYLGDFIDIKQEIQN